jgi:hypothetical protein
MGRTITQTKYERIPQAWLRGDDTSTSNDMRRSRPSRVKDRWEFGQQTTAAGNNIQRKARSAFRGLEYNECVTTQLRCRAEAVQFTA